MQPTRISTAGTADDGTHSRPVSRWWIGFAEAVLLAVGLWAIVSAGSSDTGHWPGRIRNDTIARPSTITASLCALPSADSVADLSVDEERPAESDGWHAWYLAPLGCERLWVAAEGRARVGYGDHLRCRGPPTV